MRIIPISLKAANEFLKENHRHNGPVYKLNHKVSIGLQKEGVLIGVAVIGRPSARLLDDGETAEVLRVCVKEGFKNGCSKLYGRARRIAQLLGYKKVITYTLERESQSSLKAVGAIVEKKVKPGNWNRPNRKRQEQDVYREPKVRWKL